MTAKIGFTVPVITAVSFANYAEVEFIPQLPRPDRLFKIVIDAWEMVSRDRTIPTKTPRDCGAFDVFS